MAEDAAEIRDVDPAELYYWLFDHVGAMSVVAYAELDRRIDPDVLRDALAAVQRRHPLLRLRLHPADGKLQLVPTVGPIPLEVRTLDPAAWVSVLEAEMDRRLEPSDGPSARCLLLSAPDVDWSVAILVTHHALSDGRSSLSVLQELLRVVESGVEVLGPPYDVPLGLHDRYPAELRPARAMVTTVRAIQAEREGLAAPARFDLDTAAGRDSRLTRLVLGPDQVASLRRSAKENGASLYGFLAASVLQSASELMPDVTDPVLCLASPTDLRSRATAPIPADELVLAIGLLSSPYQIRGVGGPELAARVSSQVQREVDRGDSHLFYRLARAGSFRADGEGAAAFAAWLATTPHNTAVSNVGVIDHTGDPAWLTNLAVLLAPGPNQLGFVVLSTYRDEMTVHVILDAARVQSDHRAELVSGIVERTGARLREDGSGEH